MHESLHVDTKNGVLDGLLQVCGCGFGVGVGVGVIVCVCVVVV